MEPESEHDWSVTTDHDRIVEWASENDAAPVIVEGPEDRVDLTVTPVTVSGHRIDWERFFEHFEEQGLALRYTPDGDPALAEVVARGTSEGADTEAAPTTDTEAPSAMSESARGAEDPAITLDEIYLDPGPGSDPDEEYLVFEHTGEGAIDLTGWTVESDDGRTYTFPDGCVLEAGERLTLYSGTGPDDGLSWGASEPLWDDTGGTVTLRDGAGRVVVSEPYRDG